MTYCESLMLDMLQGTTAQLGVSRMYPNNGDFYTRQVYQGDLQTFRKHKGRTCFIRKQYYREVDKQFGNINLAVWDSRPDLWVLVTQYGKGVHRTEPVYRGTAFFDVAGTTPYIAKHESDEEVGLTLLQMEAAHGQNAEEVGRWMTEFLAKAPEQMEAEQEKLRNPPVAAWSQPKQVQ